MGTTISRWLGHLDTWLQRLQCVNPTICECGHLVAVVVTLYSTYAISSLYPSSADVYSFSMLLWEIVTLEKPMMNYTYSQLKQEVFIEGQRPPLKNVFNKKMRDLISLGWSQRPKTRPSMDAVYDEIRGEYVRMARCEITENAVTHDRRRSTHVARSKNGGVSLKHLMSVN